MSGLADEQHGEEQGEQHDEAQPEAPANGGSDPAAPDPVASDPVAPDSVTPDQVAQAQATIEAMLGAIRDAKVGELILSSVSTLASVAYGKLEAKELAEARLAIDAVGALLPLLNNDVDAGIRRDFEQALANLRLAYADAVSSG